MLQFSQTNKYKIIFQSIRFFSATKFSVKNFSWLANDRYARYPESSAHNAHALICKDSAGQEVAYQYNVPHSIKNNNNPKILPLINIEKIKTIDNKIIYQATTENNFPMFSVNFNDFSYAESSVVKEFRIVFFAPNLGKIFDQILINHEKTTNLELDYKGGRELSLDPDSIRVRSHKSSTRRPSQNQVMGRSANQEYIKFLDENTKKINQQTKNILYKSIIAKQDNLNQNFFPEWLHIEGFALTDLSINPQRKDNLAAGPRWANSQMSILERIAIWFALNRQDNLVKITPHFTMLSDSEIVQKINVAVEITEENKKIKISQEINPLAEFPILNSAVDLAQTIAIFDRLFAGVKPISEQQVFNINTNKFGFFQPKNNLVIKNIEHDGGINKRNFGLTRD